MRLRRLFWWRFFPKNIQAAERPPLTNKTRILQHNVLCRPVLHVGRVVYLGKLGLGLGSVTVPFEQQ